MSDARVAPAPAPTRTIATVADAELLIKHLIEVMDALVEVVEEETDLVRAGHLRDATRLEPEKADLAQRYAAAAVAVKANAAFLSRHVPRRYEEMRRMHDTFHALLQTNLTVLATAHAVSEGIIRGVSGELARKAAPRTYGMSGRTTAPAASAYRPVALSRTL